MLSPFFYGVFEMAYRTKMTRSASKKNFSKRADLTHKKNFPTRVPMRGGIRL